MVDSTLLANSSSYLTRSSMMDKPLVEVRILILNVLVSNRSSAAKSQNLLQAYLGSTEVMAGHTSSTQAEKFVMEPTQLSLRFSWVTRALACSYNNVLSGRSTL